MTRGQRVLASGLIGNVAAILRHPDLPEIGGEEHHKPRRLAAWLERDSQLVAPPGRILEKQYVLGDLQHAADYLSHPSVQKLKFALPPANYADALREIIRDLKPKTR